MYGCTEQVLQDKTMRLPTPTTVPELPDQLTRQQPPQDWPKHSEVVHKGFIFQNTDRLGCALPLPLTLKP